MFKGDAKLRAEGEKLTLTDFELQELIRCKEDIIHFAETYFTIVDAKKGHKGLIVLREYQKRILKAFVSNPDGLRNTALLSSRQIGKSTISTIFLTWYSLFNKDKLIAIVADKEKTSKNILGRIKEAYKRFPIWLQQGIRPDGWNAKSLALENGSTMVISSTTGTALTGESIALLYIDEFAKIPTHLINDFMDSVFPTVEANPNAKIMIVSTPKGLNHWYDIWRKAISKENDFFPIKINWYEVPDRDEKFKQRIIRSRGMLHWRQEYEASFLGSSTTLIEPDVLERIQTKEPIDYKLGQYLSIYEHPIPGCNYVLGIDTAKGTSNDYSVIQVLKIINRTKLVQVAVYRCNTISTNNYAQTCIEVSKFYNEAVMMIENNDIGDGVANTIWHTFEYDKIINCDPKGIGVRSTKKSKLEANLNLKRYMESGWLELFDKRTQYELSRYEEVEGKINVFKAINNENDDAVTSLIWAVYFLITKFYEDELEMYEGLPEIERQNRIEDNYPVMIIDNGGGMPIMDDVNTQFLLEGGRFPGLN